MANRTLTTVSDEDEDGDLSEFEPPPSQCMANEVLPTTEVIYLPVDTSCFKQEDERVPETLVLETFLIPSDEEEDDIIIEKEVFCQKNNGVIGHKRVKQSCYNHVKNNVSHTPFTNNFNSSFKMINNVIVLDDEPNVVKKRKMNVALNAEASACFDVGKTSIEKNQSSKIKIKNRGVEASPKHILLADTKVQNKMGETSYKNKQTDEVKVLSKQCETTKKKHTGDIRLKYKENETSSKNKHTDKTRVKSKGGETQIQNKNTTQTKTNNHSATGVGEIKDSSQKCKKPNQERDKEARDNVQLKNDENEIKKKTLSQKHKSNGKSESKIESLVEGTLTPSVKRNILSEENSAKKAKYSKQDTPICNALMKEYANKKNSGSQITDIMQQFTKNETNINISKTIDKIVERMHEESSTHNLPETVICKVRRPMVTCDKIETSSTQTKVKIKESQTISLMGSVLNQEKEVANSSVKGLITPNSPKTVSVNIQNTPKRKVGRPKVTCDKIETSSTQTKVKIKESQTISSMGSVLNQEKEVANSSVKSLITPNSPKTVSVHFQNPPKRKVGRPRVRFDKIDKVKTDNTTDGGAQELNTASSKGTVQNQKFQGTQSNKIEEKTEDHNKYSKHKGLKRRGRRKMLKEKDPSYHPLNKINPDSSLKLTRNSSFSSIAETQLYSSNKSLKPSLIESIISSQYEGYSRKIVSDSQLICENKTQPEKQPSSDNLPPKSLRIAKTLRSVANKVVNLLAKDASINIVSYTEKLLKAAQELYDLNCLNSEILVENVKHIKPENFETFEEIEFCDTFEDNKNMVSHYIHLNSTPLLSKESVDEELQKSTYTIENTLRVVPSFDQLKDKLKNKVVEDISTNMLPNTSHNSIIDTFTNFSRDQQNVFSDVLQFDDNEKAYPIFGSRAMSAEDRYSFVIDYFRSFQQVFDNKVIHTVIPLLSKIILSCIYFSSEYFQFITQTQNFLSGELKQQKINEAKQFCSIKIKKESLQFFSIFNMVAENINNKKTEKAIVFTLLFFVTNSLYMRAPKFKGQISRVRYTLRLLCKVNRNHHPCVWEILEISAKQHDEEIQFLIQMLNYFQKQMFFSMSINQLIGGGFLYEKGGDNFQLFENISTHMDSSEIADCLDPMIHRREFNGMYDSSNLNTAEDRISKHNPDEMTISSLLGSQPYPLSKRINDSNESNTELSKLAAQFVNTLDAERKYDTRRIEQKLDSILKVLNSSCESKEKSFSSNPGKQINNKKTRNTGHPFEDLKKPNNQTNAQENKSFEILRFPDQTERNSQLSQLLEKDHTAVTSLFESFESFNKPKKVSRSKPQSHDYMSDTTYQSSSQWLGVKTVASLPVNAAGNKQGGSQRPDEETAEAMISTTQNQNFCEDKNSMFPPFDNVWVASPDYDNCHLREDSINHDGLEFLTLKTEVIDTD